MALTVTSFVEVLVEFEDLPLQALAHLVVVAVHLLPLAGPALMEVRQPRLFLGALPLFRVVRYRRVAGSHQHLLRLSHLLLGEVSARVGLRQVRIGACDVAPLADTPRSLLVEHFHLAGFAGSGVVHVILDGCLVRIVMS